MKLINLVLSSTIILNGYWNITYKSNSLADVKKPQYLINLVDKSQNEKPAFLFNIIKHARYLPLQGKKDFYIKEASRIKVYKDKIYVFDRLQNKLFIFSSNGVPLRQVLAIGRGPGEVSKAWDFDIDVSKDCLNVLDVNSKKLVKFDLEGNFINEIVNKFQSFYLSCKYPDVYNFFVGYYDKSAFNLHITNDLGVEKRVLFPFPGNMKSMFLPFCGYLTSNKWGILYSDACSNEIYQINSDGKILLKYKMNFGTKSWPEERKFEFYPYFDEMKKFSINLLRSFYEENEDGLVFEYQLGHYIYSGYYIKATNKIFWSESGLKDDLFYKYLKSPRGLTEEGDFIAYLDPLVFQRELSAYLKANKKLVIHEDLLTMVNQSDDITSNIILVFYSLNPV